MSRWTMRLIPTNRPSSLGNCNQLSYRLSHDGQDKVTYPPRLEVKDTLRLAISFDNAGFPDGVVLPRSATAKMSILSTSLEPPFVPLPYDVDMKPTSTRSSTVEPDELYWEGTITSSTDSFRFRLKVVVTKPGETPVTTIYTVDPEMAVGDN